MSTRETTGRYLYADYTPFEDNKNFLTMLRDFVSLTERLLRAKGEIESATLALSAASNMCTDLTLQFRKFKSEVSASMDSFNERFDAALAAGPQGSTAFDSKAAVAAMLDDTEKRFSVECGRYGEHLSSRVAQLKKTSAEYLQQWLLADHANLPYTITSRMSGEVSVSMGADLKHYAVSRSSSIVLGDAAGNEGALITYSFDIDATDLEFWSRKRKVSDLGLKEVVLPIGFKVSMSERLRKPFKLSRDRPPEREPDFANVDSYHIISVILRAKSVLEAVLAADASKPDYDCVKIVFPDVQDVSCRPIISALTKDKHGNIVEERDILQHDQVRESADTRNIVLLGKALYDRAEVLKDPKVYCLRSRLASVMVRIGDSQRPVARIAADSTEYDPTAAVLFLESIARSFSPIVSKVGEKSREGELILRQEIEGGSRNEHVLRLDALSSPLSFSEEGIRIARLLGITRPAPDSHIATSERTEAI